jgi:hypothetical protein
MKTRSLVVLFVLLPVELSTMPPRIVVVVVVVVVEY